MNPEKDFNQNINQLVELLKRIMAHIPSQISKDFSFTSKRDKESPVNLNICFLNLFPIAMDELEELEEIYDQFMSPHEERLESSEFSQLSAADVEFLKRHGIRF